MSLFSLYYKEGNKTKLFCRSHRAPCAYQTPEVVVTIWVFPPVLDRRPVTLLGRLEPFQAVLHDA